MTRPFRPALRGALFDYDGTLADTDPLHLECWNTVLADFHVQIDDAFYGANFAGSTSGLCAARAAAAHPAAGLQPEQLAAAKDALYETWIVSRVAPLLPGVPEILAALAGRGAALAIVTGAPRAAIQRTLEQHGLAGQFQVYVTREDITHGKPSPQGYEIGLSRLGLPAQAALAFEDTVSGVQAAVAAGLPVIAIPQRWARGRDFSAATAVCADMRAALAWVEAAENWG